MRRGVGKGIVIGGYLGVNFEGKVYVVVEFMCKGVGKEKIGSGVEVGVGYREIYI